MNLDLQTISLYILPGLLLLTASLLYKFYKKVINRL